MCIVIVSPNSLIWSSQLHMTNSPNLCGGEELRRLQLLCIPWQPDRWNNPHTTLHYQPAPRITWQQTGQLWEVAQHMRNSAVAAPNGLRPDSSAPTSPPTPSSAVLQLTNFTTVLHRLHARNCILRWVRDLIWLKTNVEKGHWFKGGGERRSAQQRKLRRNVCCPEGLGLCLKPPDDRLPPSFCRNVPQYQPIWMGKISSPISWLLK